MLIRLTQSPHQRRAAAVFVLITVFLDVLGMGIITPVLPQLVGNFVTGAEAQAYWYGILAAVFGLMQFLCAPLLGALSDRYGRRPVLLLALTGLAINFLLMALAPSLLWLLIARLVGGATSANISVANAYIIDVSSADTRAKNLGMIGVAFGLGFIVGPILGGLLGDVDLHLPFYVASGLAIVNVLYGYFVLPESLAEEHRSRHFTLASVNPFAILKGLLELKDVMLLICAIAFINMAQFMLQSTWILFTTFRFHWTPSENGFSLFLVGLSSVIAQGFVLGKSVQLIGEVKTAILSLLSGAIAFLLYGLVPLGWMLNVVIVANLLIFLAGPALSSIVSSQIDSSKQGLIMGSLSSISSVMSVVGTLLGTTMMAQVTHFPQQDWRVGSVFYLCALLHIIALILAAYYLRNQVKQKLAYSATDPGISIS